MLEVISMAHKRTQQLGLKPTPQGIRQAVRVKQGLDAAHSKPGFKQAASKFLKKVPTKRILSAGVKTI